ncbi:MAG: hypothetical protein JO112_20425, partial [Planctomycetes bacterium]|nr:hypothetical protein [Planctomycetota bacterium]
FNHGAGNPETTSLGQLAEGHAAQVGVQLVAALAACAYAFLGTLVLVKLLDLLFGFCIDPRVEAEGLDRREHGEVGFDLGPGLELEPTASAVHEPRPALVPPVSPKHFTVVVDGVIPEDLIRVWSDLCQAGPRPPRPEFRTIYPYVTTVQGNRFRFRGGDPNVMKDNLQHLFADYLAGQPVQAHVE